ncbi:MAG: ABC transporter permease [Bacillota bacterium]
MKNALRHIRHFGAFGSITLKEQTAYTAWFWSDLLGQVVLMLIAVAFWRAVYAATPSLRGLEQEQTIAFVLVANTVGLVVRWSMIWDFGVMIRDGSIGIELLRPVDFQLRMYATKLVHLGATIIRQMLLLGAFAYLFLGLRLTTDLRVWLAFALSMLLGNAILFFFDWTLSLVAFYSTELRGLIIMRDGIAVFFSGFLIPLALLPDWLQRVAALLPFGQVLNTPVAILTGIIPLADLPAALLGQLAWLAGLAAVSRPAFGWAVRKVTVQGG